MRKWATCLLVTTSLLASGSAFAQGQTLPAGPNREVVSRACQTCHDLGMVLAATGLTRDGWESAIDEMISYGMRVEPNERMQIVEYLSTYLGPSAAAAPR
jgi:hypothetical protein